MYDKNNVFAKIIRKEIPADIIYEDEQVIAIKDIAPAAPIHILVLPKKEYISFHDFMGSANAEEISHFYKTIHKICSNLKIDEKGYRVICNIGKDGMQTVPHMHLHIVAGRALGRLGN